MNFYTTIMGSGAAVPTSTRHCSGQVVNVGGYRLLLDCGEGTQHQMRLYHQKLQSLQSVCLSHLHGDHFFGLPGLLATMHLCGRKEPVTVIGPQGLRQALDTLLTLSSTHLDYELQLIELSHNGRQLVFTTPRCRLTAFPIWHSVPTYGYIIEEIPRSQSRPRRMAYCSDTGYHEELIEFVRAVDLLCIESTFADDMTAVAAEKQHLTASQAATIAREAGVGQLLLTHFSARYRELDLLEQQAMAIFPNTVLATDGMVCPIGYTQAPALV